MAVPGNVQPALAMLLLAAIVSPAAAGLATLALPRKLVLPRVLLALAGPIVTLILLGTFLLSHGTDAGRVSAIWMPSLHLDLAFLPDKLGMFFATLVASIGTLILLYARGYFGPDPAGVGKFYPLIGVFMTAMLGLVLADDFILMLLFWELTSISSFLLIGWDIENRKGIKNAMQALATTGLGGLALLGGLIWLALIAGGWNFSGLEHGSIYGTGTLGAFLLIYAGVATKSAQFPLHYWLPGAMLAPTPISAYLHSAAMVKAGIYLLARLWPAFSNYDLWPIVIVSVGAVTMLYGAWVALQRDVLKQILAYTTVSQLGLLAAAFGLAAYEYHDEANLVWGNTQILNHALYKASLFILAGGVTHALGRKALSECRGLWHEGGQARIFAGLFIVGFIALAALPGTYSFFAKEAFLYQIVHALKHGWWLWLVLVSATLTSVLNVAIAWRFIAALLDHSPKQEAEHEDDHKEHHDDHGHDSPMWSAMLWLPAALLLAVQMLGGLGGPIVAWAVMPLEASPFYWHSAGDLSLWHAVLHPGWPLGISVLAIVLGVALGMSPLLRGMRGDFADHIYPKTNDALERGGAFAFRLVQTGSLRWYLFATLAMLCGVLMMPWMIALYRGLDINPTQAHLKTLPHFWSEPAAYLLCALLVASALIMTLIRDRASRVLILGAVGSSVTGLFYLYAAPDLALTQLSVEIVSLVLFLLVLNLLPEEKLGDRSIVLVRVAAAVVVGVVVTVVLLQASSSTQPRRVATLSDGSRPETIGDWVLRNSYYGNDTAYVDPASVGDGVVDRGEKHLHGFGSHGKFKKPAGESITLHKGGGGNNSVNVTLVDIRGFDTFGEITVLALAAIGVWTLLRKPPSSRDQEETDNRSAPHEDTFKENNYGYIPPMQRPRGTKPIESQFIATIILRQAARLLLPLALVFSAYLFFKGHQTPGGGFVGGLATAVALVVYRQCFGCDALYKLLPVRERYLIATGLSLAIVTAVAPLAFGLPLLTSNQGYLPLPGAEPFHWATVMVFDLGVYLVVVGAVVGMIDALARELES